jgi:hypothetical protein
MMTLQEVLDDSSYFTKVEVVYHSRNMPEPVAIISTEVEYNEAGMDCIAMIQMHMTLNHIEEVED